MIKPFESLCENENADYVFGYVSFSDCLNIDLNAFVHCCVSDALKRINDIANVDVKKKLFNISKCKKTY